MRALNNITGSFTDFRFVCKWEGRDETENRRANNELETAQIQCGGLYNLNVERELGKIIFSGLQTQVNCIYNYLHEHGWKQEGGQVWL